MTIKTCFISLCYTSVSTVFCGMHICAQLRTPENRQCKCSCLHIEHCYIVSMRVRESFITSLQNFYSLSFLSNMYFQYHSSISASSLMLIVLSVWHWYTSLINVWHLSIWPGQGHLILLSLCKVHKTVRTVSRTKPSSCNAVKGRTVSIRKGTGANPLSFPSLSLRSVFHGDCSLLLPPLLDWPQGQYSYFLELFLFLRGSP